MTSLTTSKFSLWVLAARPKTLPAAGAPVLVAIAFSIRAGSFQLLPAVACLLISLVMQIGANISNDLFDNDRGSDTEERLGPTRMTASGLISAREMRIATILIFGFTAFIGLYLVWLRGWGVLILGIAIILAALAYTGGPFPYGYYALGDVFVFLSFGLAAVCGSYYAIVGKLPVSIILAAIPIGLLIVNILVVNNTRDIDTDRSARKHTLAVLLGRGAMQIEYLVCLLGAYLIPLGMWLLGITSWGVIFTWLSFPLAISQYRKFTRFSGRELNLVLAGTAQLALIFSILFSLGIVLVR